MQNMKLDRLTGSYGQLSSLEKKVVEFMASSPEEVVKMTARDLSEKLFISKTTIINLCKKLGFEGYTELKYYLKSSSEEEKKVWKEIEEVSFSEILRDLREEAEKTLDLQKEENVAKMSEILQSARTVYVVARGASKPFGSYLNTRLAMLKIRTIFVDDFNLIDNIKDHIEPDEAVLLLSLSGNTKRILDIAKGARIRGAKVLVITGFSDNKVEKYADSVLYAYAKTTDTEVNDLISRVGMHLTLQILLTYTQKMLEKRRT